MGTGSSKESLTMGALLTQLAQAKEDGTPSEIFQLAERMAKKVKTEFGISEDEAQYVIKDPFTYKTEKGAEDTRLITSYISTVARDRDYEVVMPEGGDLADYRTLPVVLYGHRYGELGVGKNIWIVPNSEESVSKMFGLVARTKYASVKANPFADQVYNWQMEDMPMGKSIGFIPVDWLTPDDKGWATLFDKWVKRVTAFLKAKGREVTQDLLEPVKRIFTKWLLLEYSDVMVPSNAHAVNLALRKGLIYPEEQKKLVDPEDQKQFLSEHSITDIEAHTTAHVLESLKADGQISADGTAGLHLPYDGVIPDPRRPIEIPYLEGKRVLTEEDIEDHWESVRTKVDDSTEVQAEGGRLFDEESLIESARIAIDGNEGEVSFETLKEGDYIPPEPESEDRSVFTPFHFKEARIGMDGRPELPDGMWNDSLPKSFDIAEYEDANVVFRHGIFTQYLECKVKEIYVNTYDIPSPLVGTYLVAIEEMTKDFDVEDTRRFSGNGVETPPSREWIQLNSKDRRRFLVGGSQYCKYTDEGLSKLSIPLVKDFAPGWYGLQFSIITSMEYEAFSDEMMGKIHQYANENHVLRGEKFALSGKFLEPSGVKWEDLVLESKDLLKVTKSLELATQRENGRSRGLLFAGPPGTGKTFTGKAILDDTDSTFIWLSARDMMYSWPPRVIALAFDMAHRLAPTVLFMEDIDHSLDVDMLKTEMDGMRTSRGVVTILTTNTPERLPLALVDRPGRFHHVLHFDLPNAEERAEMLRMWADGIDEKVLKEVVDCTEGLSGAHIRELVDFAEVIAEDEGIDIGKALVLSMLRMNEQVELVSELTNVSKSGIIENSDETTPDMIEAARMLLEVDDTEKANPGDRTPNDNPLDKRLQFMEGDPV